MIDSKVILITGVSSGLGKAIADHLAQKRARVFGALRDSATRNAQAAAALTKLGINVIDIDVANDMSVETGVAAAIAAAGRVDVLINCAGIMPTGVTEAFSVAQFEQTLQTNLVGPFRMMKAVLPSMRDARSGLLINITSIGGRFATPGFGIYAATKWGLEGLAETIGYEISDFGIDSVILEPGLYLTDLRTKGGGPADVKILESYGALPKGDKNAAGRMRSVVAESGISTNPTTLAAYVETLIDMPAGSRPVRTTIGFDAGVAELNAATASHQIKYMAFMGLSGAAH